MKTLENLKRNSVKLKNEITAVYYARQSPKVKLLPRVIIILTLGYALSPVDLIPDFIPVLGYLDDLIIIPVLIALSIKLIPQDIMAVSREKASKEPLHLKKNGIFAVLFIIFWAVLIACIILFVLKLITE